MEPAKEKVNLRKRFRDAVARLTSAERQEASTHARGQLLKQPVWQDAMTVLFYAPMADEIDLWPLAETALTLGKRIALPRFVPEQNAYEVVEVTDLETELHRGLYGVPEPGPECRAFPQNDLDLLLIPGLGFSTAGVRIGRGKGYYDRLLANIQGTKCGVGFDCQVDDRLPTEPHDILLDFILTPTFGLVAAHRNQA